MFVSQRWTWAAANKECALRILHEVLLKQWGAIFCGILFSVKADMLCAGCAEYICKAWHTCNGSILDKREDIGYDKKRIKGADIYYAVWCGVP